MSSEKTNVTNDEVVEQVMSSSLDWNEKVAGNLFEFLPEELIVDEVVNLRPFSNGNGSGAAAQDDAVESIEELAEAIKTHGQIEPVVVRVDKEGMPHLIAGNRRVAAVGLINAGLGEGEEPWRVKAVVSLSAQGDSEAWGMAWSENKDRRNMSPMDVALNIKQARVMFDAKGAAGTGVLAEKLGVSPAYVRTHEKLLKLDAGLQSKVHRGELGVDAALKAEAVPEEKRDEVIEVAKGIAAAEQVKTDTKRAAGGGAVPHSRKAKAGKGGKGAIKARHIVAAKRKVAGASKKAEPRSKGELIEWVESELLSPVFGYANGDVHKWANYLLAWLKGEGTDRGLVERFKIVASGASIGTPIPIAEPAATLKKNKASSKPKAKSKLSKPISKPISKAKHKPAKAAK